MDGQRMPLPPNSPHGQSKTCIDHQEVLFSKKGESKSIKVGRHDVDSHERYFSREWRDVVIRLKMSGECQRDFVTRFGRGRGVPHEGDFPYEKRTKLERYARGKERKADERPAVLQ